MTTNLSSLTTKNGVYDVKMPNLGYSMFVKPNQFRSSMTLAYDRIGEISKESSVEDANQEKYVPSLTIGSNYSTCIVRELNFVLNATDVKYSQNRSIMAAAFDPTITTLSGYAGLSHAINPGISGFVTDPLNAAVSNSTISLGSNSHQVNTNLTPQFVNAIRQSCPKNVLLNQDYCGLLHSETVSLDNLALDINKSHVLPFTPTVNMWNRNSFSKSQAKNSLAGCYINTADAYKNRVLLSNNILTLDQVNNGKNNRLSYHYRGEVFKYATYHYVKSQSSPNYKINFNSVAGIYAIVEALPATTELYSMQIGPYNFPSHISNWREALEMGISVYDLIWYHDSLHYMSRKKTDAVDGDNSVVDDTDIEFVSESAGQGLNISVTFAGIKSPVICPIFNDEHRRSISHLANMELTFNHHQNLYNEIFRIIGKAGSNVKATGQLPTADETELITNVSNNGNCKLIIDTVNKKPKIIMRHFKMMSIIESQKEVTTCLSYQEVKSDIVPFTITINPSNLGETYRSFRSQEIRSPLLDLSGGIPRYVMFYTNLPITSRVSALSLRYDSGSDVQLLKINSLDNGLVTKSRSNESSYLFLTNQSKNAFTNVGGPYYNNVAGSGVCYMLEFGQDIVLPDSQSIAGMVSSKNHKLEFVLTLDFDDVCIGKSASSSPGDIVADSRYNTSELKNCQLHFKYFHESDLYIENNQVSSNKQLITGMDVVALTSKFINDQRSGTFEASKVEEFTGGMGSSKKKMVRNRKVALSNDTNNNTIEHVPVHEGGNGLDQWMEN